VSCVRARKTIAFLSYSCSVTEKHLRDVELLASICQWATRWVAKTSTVNSVQLFVDSLFRMLYQQHVPMHVRVRDDSLRPPSPLPQPWQQQHAQLQRMQRWKHQGCQRKKQLQMRSSKLVMPSTKSLLQPTSFERGAASKTASKQTSQAC
jgi:hypothetical protein